MKYKCSILPAINSAFSPRALYFIADADPETTN
jgi:hypothetical protein